MVLHLIKLAVGIDDPAHLAKVQKRYRLPNGNPRCRTRMTPKRAEELTAGGSLFWVINGYIMVRQKILAIHQKTDGGRPQCLIELAKRPVLVQPTHRRPFQGWRYLKPDDAPPDIKGGKIYIDPKMPKAMQSELRKLGLI